MALPPSQWPCLLLNGPASFSMALPPSLCLIAMACFAMPPASVALPPALALLMRQLLESNLRKRQAQTYILLRHTEEKKEKEEEKGSIAWIVLLAALPARLSPPPLRQSQPALNKRAHARTRGRHRHRHRPRRTTYTAIHRSGSRLSSHASPADTAQRWLRQDEPSSRCHLNPLYD
ncbi:hypothetical protein EYF80_031572 [Liparis tanakae]|uniref:Uncharacterized protein n=1 Tax=Liparis tanakae TaxID=230148 RepID=A0A4Z2GZZ4_9TELE|nr:hypothetical protein EYF80_031572 [Liparis tanakae]